MRMYGRCVAYLNGVVERPLAIGEMVKFQTTPHIIVAKRDLGTAVGETRGLDTSRQIGSLPEKRQCVHPLGEDGKLVDDTGNKVKGTFTFILDLDGVRHVTRNKTDVSCISERERRNKTDVSCISERENWHFY